MTVVDFGWSASSKSLSASPVIVLKNGQERKRAGDEIVTGM
jgi:hypothetical protein